MTREEYEAGLARVVVLAELDPAFDTPEWAELDALVTQLESYERDNPPPGGWAWQRAD